MGRCRRCGRRVRWVETEEGYRQPLDPEPVVAGNIVLEQASCSEGALQVFRAVVLPSGSHWPGPRYMSHLDTCPKRRRRRGAGR